MQVRRRIIIVITCLVGAVLSAAPRGAGVVTKAAAAASALPAQLTLEAGGQPIPRSFFGLSVEYDELSDYEALGPAFSNVVALIRPENGSRMLLRIGGKSADRTYFVTGPERPVPYGHPIGLRWLQDLETLVAANRLRVMLDLNLAVHSPIETVSFVRAAKAELGASLFGVVIGNEPDLYWRGSFLTKERLPSTTRSIPKLWTSGLFGGRLPP